MNCYFSDVIGKVTLPVKVLNQRIKTLCCFKSMYVI